jgi:hypothetical protein
MEEEEGINKIDKIITAKQTLSFFRSFFTKAACGVEA